MRTGTATRAATRSATSAGEIDLHVPNLQALGLGNIRPLERRAACGGAGGLVRPHGRSLARQGLGDGTLGDRRHRPRPAVSDVSAGIPARSDRAFEREIGRATLGNEVASGTEIIERLGDAHVASGKPIVYTSADSVFQIAAHEDVVPVPELYRMCEAAYRLVVDGLGVGRVIARPFVGAVGRVHEDSEPARLRDALAAADVAGSPVDCRRAGRRDRKDRRPVRGPGHHPSAAHAVR